MLHKFVGYTIFFQKPSMLFVQVMEKMKESFTLFSRMLLKSEYKETEFETLYEINFKEPSDTSCKDKLCNKEEFIYNFI